MFLPGSSSDSQIEWPTSDTPGSVWRNIRRPGAQGDEGPDLTGSESGDILPQLHVASSVMIAGNPSTLVEHASHEAAMEIDDGDLTSAPSHPEGPLLSDNEGGSDADSIGEAVPRRRVRHRSVGSPRVTRAKSREAQYSLRHRAASATRNEK